ncbi:MAG: hypothetical protein EU530_04275 [Promethearchaeota archaeon]|nr:MAG: hypothetical protein EU530_04275 [Candidatus Lokiarchaeota archaeon]
MARRIRNKSKLAGKYLVKRKKTKVELEKDAIVRQKELFYWAKAITGAVAGFLGVYAFELVGWWMFIYMILMWFGFPWILSFGFFRFRYDKENWSWKEILKEGAGIFFLTFMLVSTVFHTIKYFPIFDHFIGL